MINHVAQDGSIQGPKKGEGHRGENVTAETPSMWHVTVCTSRNGMLQQGCYYKKDQGGKHSFFFAHVHSTVL